MAFTHEKPVRDWKLGVHPSRFNTLADGDAVRVRSVGLAEVDSPEVWAAYEKLGARDTRGRTVFAIGSSIVRTASASGQGPGDAAEY